MRILIVGADRLGRLLAADLLHAGHDVRVLDARGELLSRLPHDFEGRTVRGSPLDRDTLTGAADGCDAIGCVSEDDNLNAVVALAARRDLHVPLALAVVANPRRAEALSGLGAHVVCPTSRTAHALQLVLVRSGVETELVLGAGLAVYRVEIPPRLSGRALAELGSGAGLLPVAVERGPEMLLAAPGLALRDGDVLHVAATDRERVSELTRP
jgi:Trk K+ transport system NAD-binding subunit